MIVTQIKGVSIGNPWDMKVTHGNSAAENGSNVS